MKRHLPYAVAFVAVAGAYLFGALEFVDRGLSDASFHLARRAARPAVAVVAVDARTLVELETWPLSPGRHAAVLDHLLDAGASRVGFDLDFGPRGDPEAEAELERSFARAGRQAVLPLFRHGYRNGSGRFAGVVPRPALSRHTLVGSTLLRPDADQSVRSVPFETDYLGQAVASLGLALAGSARRGSGSVGIDFGIDVDTIPILSYADALEGRFDPALVRGRSVLVGATAVELGDPVPVPRYGTLPASLVHALAAESVAQGRALRRSGPAPSLMLALTAVLVLAALERLASRRTVLVVVLSSTVGLVLAWLMLRWWTPLVVDLSCILVALGVSWGVHLLRNMDHHEIGMLVQDRQMRRTETLMRHVVANSFDAIVTSREDGTVETFNRVAQKMFGWPEAEAVGRNISEFVKLPHAELRDRGPDHQRNYRALYESEGSTRDGRRFPTELAVTWIVADGVRRRVMFLRDITERKAQQEALRYQATHDVLTDLPNRSLLHERVEEALVAARQHAWPVAFLLLDLDRFKEINDTLGHHIGDVLLRKIARRLESNVRAQDTIARLGGDEFAVLLPGTGLDSAHQIAHGLIRSLDEPFAVEGLSLQVDTSVGITLFPEHGTGASALIRRADVAMYVAKKERTGVAVYDADQDFTSIRLLALTGDLRRAIQEDRLTLHYQPKMSARTGRPIGVEVLARWRHPEHGEIPPDEFVGLAEHSGLIRPLTRWVLETSLQQCAEWRRQGVDLSVSVNLSARNLLDEELPRSLMEMLRTIELPVDRVTLEITESVIMEDPKRALEVLTELHEIGVAIAIDDFGTGYSSLGYLKKLPADELKIDKSFVLDMDRNADDETIVHSTIELAHNLGLRVVAEGVETEEIWARLRRLGCDTGQGFLFSRPLPAGRLIEWYRETIARVEPAAASEAS